MGFPGGTSRIKKLPAYTGDTRDLGSIIGSGRFPGGGHGNPLRYSCLENPMDEEAWWPIVYNIAKSQTHLKQLSMHTCKHYFNRMFINIFEEDYKTLPRDIKVT